jgi:hypothetical protein
MLLPSMSRHRGERFSRPRVILVTWPTVLGLAGALKARAVVCAEYRSSWEDCLSLDLCIFRYEQRDAVVGWPRQK